MIYLVLALGWLILGVGLFGIALPKRMLGLMRRVTFTDSLRYLGAFARFAIGLALYLAAGQTRFPLALEILGILSVLAGMVLLLLRRETLQRWLGLAVSWPPGVLRAICAIALLLGGFLIWASWTPQ